MIYWQRVQGPLQKIPNEAGDEGHPDFGHRPPSYVSDNGVDYVINAQPNNRNMLTN
jgi:hypothetical protein